MSARTRLLLPLIAIALTLALTGCGDDDTASEDSSETSDDGALNVIGLDSLAFDKTEYDAAAGTIDIVYTAEDGGVIYHDLLIEGYEDELVLEIMGDTDTGSIDLESGDYVMYCSVAGHREAGMVADLTVS